MKAATSPKTRTINSRNTHKGVTGNRPTRSDDGRTERKINMTINDLKTKVQKAEEAVQKARKTIERHTVQMEKKLKVVTDHGWDPEDRYCRYGTPEHHEAYWAICDYDSKVSDIEGATKKLAEKTRILNNWKDRLEAAEAKEHKFLTEVPECMKVMMAELIADWDEHDKDRRERLIKVYNEVGHSAFFKGTAEGHFWDTHTHADYEFMHLTDEDIHKDNARSAKGLIMDLYSRINAITGEVTDWDGIHYGGKSLNGVVHGKLGSVNVESILAGGYNIQRLHIRVLVHEIH